MKTLIKTTLLIVALLLFVLASQRHFAVVGGKDETLTLLDSLNGKTEKEKKNVYAQVFAEKVLLKTYSVNGLDIQILSITAIDGGVEVMARAFRNGVQLGFGSDGSVDIERFRFWGIETLVEDSMGSYSTTYLNPTTQQTKTVKYSSNPTKALTEALAETMLIAARNGTIEPGKVGHTTDTFYPVAGENTPVDGHTFRYGVNEPLATIIAGAGNLYQDTNGYISPGLRGSATSNQYERVIRGHTLFNTAIIGTDSITSATYSVNTQDGKQSALGAAALVVVPSNPANTNVLANSDHEAIGNTSLGFAAYGSISTTGYTDMVLNASGIAQINKSGISKFGLRMGFDNGSGTPTWASGAYTNTDCRSADTTGTASDPKLVVVHEASAAPTATQPVAPIIIF